MLAQLLTSSNDMRIFLFNYIALLIASDTLDGIYLSKYFLIVGILWRWNELRHISVIDGKLQLGTSQKLLHTGLLVFHQRIQRIEEDGLHFFCHIVVY